MTREIIYMEDEELSEVELAKIEQASKGPFLTKKEFLKLHPDVSE